MFYVTGGVYTDFSWTTLEEGKEENYGPYATYDEAYIKWLEIARFKVDNACHKVTIVRRDEDE